MKDKGLEGVDSFQTDRVARAVEEAEKHLAAMKDAILRANDRGLTDAGGEVPGDGAGHVPPGGAGPARPDGGAAVSGRLPPWRAGRDGEVRRHLRPHPRPAGRADYEALLDDLEKEFAARTEKLLLDDRTNLDIEIEVLRERLEREGVQAK